MKKLLLSLGMGLFAWWSAVGQTTLNTTVGSTGYTGTNSSGTNSYITFLVENNSGGDIFLTNVGNWTSSTDNGVTVTLLASTLNLSGAPGTVTPPGTIPAGWTTVATNVVSGIPSTTLGVNNVINNLTYLIPSGSSVRFLLHTTGTNRYSGTGAGTCTPNTFTSAGVSLKVGDVQIGGLNVGYGGPNNPRFFTGSITFAPAGPCTSPPFVGSATSSNATPCAGQTFGLSLDTATFGTGQTYQWEISTNNVNWTAISGATGASLNTSQIASSYYRVLVTCSTTVASGSVFVYTGPAITPLLENFTGPTGSSSNPAAPGCWSYWEPAGHAGWGYTIASTLSRSLPNRWYFYNGSNLTDYIYFVSPQIQGLDSGAKQISFWQTSGNSSYSTSVVVGTVADPANPSATFSPIDTLTTGNAWTEFIVLLDSANGYNGTHQFIAFAYKDGISFRQLYLDDIAIEDIPPCPKPTALNALNITGTTALLDWEGVGGSYSVQWGPCGFNTGTGGTFISNISGTSTSVTGLAGNTCYEYYVRADCGVNGLSAWNGPFAFTTAIVPAWLENFSGGYAPTATVPVPARWSEQYGFAANPSTFTSTSSAWNVDGFGNNGTTGAVRLSFASTSITVRDWTVTPSIDLNNGPWQFYFDLAVTTSGGTGTATMGNDDTVMVIVSTDNGATWSRSNAVAKFHAGSGLSNVGSTYTADLSAFSGQTVRIAIFGESTVSNSPLPTYDFHMDNVGVRVPPACPAPTSGVVSNVTTTNVDLTWVAGAGNLSYAVEWGPCGFVQGTGATTNVTFSGTTAVVSGLTPATCYDFYIQGSCGPGNGQSAWIGPFTATTLCLPILAPVVENFDGPSWVVGTGTTNAGSLLNTCWDRNSESVTTDFTWGPRAIVTGLGTTTGPSGDHTTGTTNFLYTESSVGASPGVATLWSQKINTSTLTNPEMRFWYHMYGTGIGKLVVSLDTGNGGFFKLDSLVGQQQTSKSAAWKEMIVSLIPYVGKNIQVRWQAFKTNTIGDFAIDDFSVISGPTCPQPTQLGANNVTSVSANLNWTSNGTNFKVIWGPQGFVPGVGGSSISGILTANFTLTGLNPTTCYEYYVRSICSPTDSSVLSGPFIFCTPCPVAFNAPYFTDFSLLGIQQTGSLPNCWNVLPGPTSTSFTWRGEEGTGANKNSLNTGPLWDNTQFGTAGGKYIYLETSSGTANDTARLISPIIVVSGLTTPMLSFYYHMHGATMGNLYTLVRTKGGPWISIDTIAGQQQLVQADPWLNRSLVLPSNLGDSIQIKFLGSRGTSFTGDMSLDDISVIQAPTCPAPNSLNSSGITSNAANLNWTSNATGTSWQVSYGAAPLTGPQAGTKVITTLKPFNLTGLSPATQFCYYVREICGPGDTSAWSPSHCFVTACVPYSIPYLEDFQSWIVGNDAPVCFSAAGGLQKWDRYVTGTNIVARANFWSFNAPNDFKLTTPQIIVSSVAQLQYKWSHLYSATYPDDALYILGRTVGSTGWDTLVAQKGPTFNSNDGAANTTPGSFIWDTVALDPTWVGQNIEIQLHGVSDFGPSVFIDSLSVVPVGGVSCPAPTALASANIVCNAFDVTFTSGSGTSYAEYGPAGFTPGSGTVVSPATSPLSITGLTTGTNYEVYVYDLCSGDTSLPAGPLAVTTASGPLPTAAFTWTVTPTLTNATVAFDASGSIGGTAYSWDFGNSSTGTGVNANGTYTANGTYNVTLIVSNACGSDTLTQAVTVAGIGVAEAALAASFQAYPNPTRGKVALSFSLMYSNAANIEIMDLSGRVVWVESAEVNGTYHRELDLSSYAAGVYLVRVSSEDGVVARRLIVE